MMHHWDGGWGVANWLLMGFGMLLFWALVVVGIVWLVRYFTSRPATPLDRPAAPVRSSARDILDARYAPVTISDEEYRSRRDTLASR